MLTVFSLLLALPGLGWAQSAETVDPAPSSLLQSRVLLQQGKTQDAIALLERLVKAQPPVKGAHHDLGVAYYRTGKLTEAQREFQAAVAENPADAESVQMEGLSLYRMGQPARAIPLLEQVRGWMPNAEADPNYVLGLCYLNAQRYDDARVAFAREFGVEAGSASAHLLLSTMLMHADLPELAGEQARKALLLDAKIPLAHFRLGEVALYKSDVEHATEEFTAERALNPGYAPAYDRLGDVYTRSGKLQEAQEALTKAISLDVTSTGPFIQMGKVLLRRDDAATAAMYLKHAEKMDPSNYITHTLLAQAYRKAGQEEAAKQELDLAAKMHGGSQLSIQPVK
jgi:tetratricopeptide (TPR) repeat protein